MRNSTSICSIADCTGCLACMNVCPKNAISVHSDLCGFEYPIINLGICIDCNLCESVCPVLHPLELNKVSKVYAAASSDDKERASSSSGGIASVVGRYILSQGGVVYGCAQKSYLDISHIRVDNLSGINLLKGSKYVQSRIGLIYRSIKKDLDLQTPVLFFGTPCQVAGLKRYLRKDYPHLYTVDLICHGVPSQQMFREDIESYLPNFISDADKQKIVVNFRWKAQYGIQFGIQFGGKSETFKPLMSVRLPKDPFILSFFTGLSFRENCHHCPYSSLSRVGDLTIGDFWGLGALQSTKFQIQKGISLVLINTLKGKETFEKLPLIVEKRSIEEAVSGNANLSHPSCRPAKKDLFLSEYRKGVGLSVAVRKAIPASLYFRLQLMEWLKRKRILVSFLKKIRLLINCILR